MLIVLYHKVFLFTSAWPCPTFCVSVENWALLLAVEPLAVVLEPAVPRELRLSREGNWKGRDTGTRLPNIPKPRGRDEGEPNRGLLPDVETCVI